MSRRNDALFLLFFSKLERSKNRHMQGPADIVRVYTTRVVDRMSTPAAGLTTTIIRKTDAAG